MSAFEVALRLLAAAVVGYLLGSIPSGVLAARIFGRTDPRAKGSGKTGATNVLRTQGLGPALLVVALDIAKGVAAVLLARFVFFGLPAHPSNSLANLQAWAEALAGLSALLGHNYSIFISFTGGRGVATGGGVMFAIQPLAGALGLLALVGTVASTRYVSLGSIMAAIAGALTGVALWLAGIERFPHVVFLVVGGAFVIYSHRDNIQRLLAGNERKLGQRAA